MQFKRNMRSRQSFLKTHHVKQVDYKDVDLLRNFISDQGKILPRKVRHLKRLRLQKKSSVKR